VIPPTMPPPAADRGLLAAAASAEHLYTCLHMAFAVPLVKQVCSCSPSGSQIPFLFVDHEAGLPFVICYTCISVVLASSDVLVVSHLTAKSIPDSFVMKLSTNWCDLRLVLPSLLQWPQSCVLFDIQFPLFP